MNSVLFLVKNYLIIKKIDFLNSCDSLGIPTTHFTTPNQITMSGFFLTNMKQASASSSNEQASASSSNKQASASVRGWPIPFSLITCGDMTFVVASGVAGQPATLINMIDKSGSMGGARMTTANQFHPKGVLTIYYDTGGRVIRGNHHPLTAGGGTDIVPGIRVAAPEIEAWQRANPGQPLHMLIVSDGGSYNEYTKEALNHYFSPLANPLFTVSVLLLGCCGCADFGEKANAACNKGDALFFGKLFHSNPVISYPRDRRKVFQEVMSDMPKYARVCFDDGSHQYVPVMPASKFQDGAAASKPMIVFPLGDKMPISINGMPLAEPTKVPAADYKDMLIQYLTSKVMSSAWGAVDDLARQEKVKQYASQVLDIFASLAGESKEVSQDLDSNAMRAARKAMKQQAMALDRHGFQVAAVAKGTFFSASSVQARIGFVETKASNKRAGKLGVSDNAMAEYVRSLLETMQALEDHHEAYALTTLGDAGFTQALQLFSKVEGLTFGMLRQAFDGMPGLGMLVRADAAVQGDALNGSVVLQLCGVTTAGQLDLENGLAAQAVAADALGHVKPNAIVPLIAPGGPLKTYLDLMCHPLMNLVFATYHGLPGSDLRNSMVGLVMGAKVRAIRQVLHADVKEALDYTAGELFKVSSFFCDMLQVLQHPVAHRLAFVNQSDDLPAVRAKYGLTKRSRGCLSMTTAYCVMQHALQTLDLEDDHWFHIGQALIEEFLGRCLRHKDVLAAFELEGSDQFVPKTVADCESVLQEARYSAQIYKLFDKLWQTFDQASFVQKADGAQAVRVKVVDQLAQDIFAFQNRGVTLQDVINLFPEDMAQRLATWVSDNLATLVFIGCTTKKSLDRMRQTYMVPTIYIVQGKTKLGLEATRVLFSGHPAMVGPISGKRAAIYRFLKVSLSQAGFNAKLEDNRVQLLMDVEEEYRLRFIATHLEWDWFAPFASEEEATAAAMEASSARGDDIFTKYHIKEVLSFRRDGPYVRGFNPATGMWTNACCCRKCKNFADPKGFKQHIADMRNFLPDYVSDLNKVLKPWCQSHPECDPAAFKAHLVKYLDNKRAETGNAKYNSTQVAHIPDQHIRDLHKVYRG